MNSDRESNSESDKKKASLLTLPETMELAGELIGNSRKFFLDFRIAVSLIGCSVEIRTGD